MIRICHASIDENGSAKGGQAGDQTGKEVCIRSWYSKPWGLLLRHPNKTIASKIAYTAITLAESNKVGYDQNERNTLHDTMKSFNHDAKAYCMANVFTETDCSAFATECAIAAGVYTLEYNGNAPTTSTMEKVFSAAGFTVLKDSKHLTTDTDLRKGDILVAPGKHTVIVIDDSKTEASEYYPKYTGSSTILVDMLNSMGIDSSSTNREKIYNANFNDAYKKTYDQNMSMVRLLQQGKLKMP